MNWYDDDPVDENDWFKPQLQKFYSKSTKNKILCWTLLYPVLFLEKITTIKKK